MTDKAILLVVRDHLRAHGYEIGTAGDNCFIRVRRVLTGRGQYLIPNIIMSCKDARVNFSALLETEHVSLVDSAKPLP